MISFVKRVFRRVKRMSWVHNVISVCGCKPYKNSSSSLQRISLILNGPSLNESINTISCDLPKLVVNNFSETEHYEKLRPEYYVIQDSSFWRQDVLVSYKENSKKVFDSLNEKTTWKVVLYLPSFADFDFVKSQVTNKNIEIKSYYAAYAVTSHRFFRSFVKPSRLLFWLWKKNYLAPPPENVIVGASYVAFLNGAKEMYLYGADMSYFNCLEVDKYNRVGIWHKRFYGDEFLIHYKDKEGSSPTTMAHELEKWAKVFYVFDVLNQFYLSNGVRVINCNKDSFIDSFEKKKD